MQQIQPLGGGGGASRIFSGGDRRLRMHNHQAQALKCPRCDSLNTKFCYYNNYNLSQPRHFCKSCRRYWTNGGVLRNVPVGGGCRKAKRARPKTPPPEARAARQRTASPRSSSSDSSSLTATTATTVKAEGGTPTVPPRRSDPCSTSSSSLPSAATFPEPRFFLAQPDLKPSFEAAGQLVDPRPPSDFPEMGGFAGLIADPSILSYGAPSAPFRLHPPPNEERALRSHPVWGFQKTTDAGEELRTAGMAEMAGRAARDDGPGAESRAGAAGLSPPVDWAAGYGELHPFDFSYWAPNHWIPDYHDHYLP